MEMNKQKIIKVKEIEGGYGIEIEGESRPLAFVASFFKGQIPEVGDYIKFNATSTQAEFIKGSNEMMDNNKQAVDIKGYRVLSQEEKDAMNNLKNLEYNLLDELRIMGTTIPGINQRSLAIAKTEIQTGFMWAIRAIARPNGE